MIGLELTGNETGPQLIAQLVALRLMARRVVRSRHIGKDARNGWESMRDRYPLTAVAGQAEQNIELLDESMLQLRFSEIEFGNHLHPLCAALDAKAPRDAVLDALEVNQSDRDTEDMRKYGGKTLNIIAVLDLESSATKDDDITTRPLKWCHTMAFMHALQTNEKLDRTIHDEANKMFNGAFGDYRERPLIERLAGQGVKR